MSGVNSVGVAGGSSQHSIPSSTVGGRFDFDDGGVYVGGWMEGKAHGNGICTGPKGQGEYSGSWSYGFELSGVYKWPSGATYEGQWQNGKRHGLGVEYRGKWVFKGEWTQGYKGRYGVRASLLSAAKYEGTWANGLQDGYGSETYADGGTYQGQWLRGTRHGYGVRQSAAFGHCNITKKAALIKSSTHASLHSLETDAEGTLVDHKRDAAMRGGFVLVVRAGSSRRRNSMLDKTGGKTPFFKGLRLKKQKSTGDLVPDRTTRSSASVASSTESAASSHRGDNDVGDAISNASFLSEEGDIHDPSTTEVYMGEWKNDKRCGFGICERSDGLRYEGEWYNNKKYGYGVTILRDGVREEGKYKNNVLVTNIKKKHLFLLRSSKTRERITSAVEAAKRAQEIALQKADIAISRTATARGKSEQADYAASAARDDSSLAFITAKSYGGSDNLASPPEVPLRRRLSEFHPQGSFRRGTKENIAQASSLQVSQSSHFLHPNVPFGGRRGSFRGNHESSPAPPSLQVPVSTAPQLNVPSLSFEPATPVEPGNQFQRQQRPSISLVVHPPQQFPSQVNQLQQQEQQHSSHLLPQSLHLQQQSHHQMMQQQLSDQSRNQYSFPPPSSQQQQFRQQLQQQPPPSLLLPQQQQLSSSFQNLNQLTQREVQLQQQQQQQQQFQLDQQLRQQQQQVYQLQQQQQMQQMHLIQNEQQQQQFLREDQRRQFQRESQQPNLSPQQPQQQQQQQRMQHHNRQSSIHHHHHQRHPQEGQAYQSQSDSFSDHFDHYSALVNRYAQSARQSAPQSASQSASLVPAGKRRSRTPVTSLSPSRILSSSPTTTLRDSLISVNQGIRPNVPDSVRGSINLETSDVISYGSMSFAGGEETPMSRGSWRTTSLIRPSVGPTGVQALRRKPSVQASTLKQAVPAMSREEAAALSHAQREHLRAEADMNERLRRNPFLYIVNPHFIAWLNRQKLVIFVIFINISLAVAFYHLFG